MHAPVVTTVDNIQEYWFKKKEMEMAEVRGRGSAVLCCGLSATRWHQGDERLVCTEQKAMKADRMFRYGVKAVAREVKQVNPVKFSCVDAVRRHVTTAAL